MYTKDGFHKALEQKLGDDAYLLLGGGGHKKLADLLESASLGASGNKTTLSITVAGTTKTGSVTVPYASSAAKWASTRTLTIGSTGKSVDGSANVSWSLDEIGVYSKTISDGRYVNVTGDTMTGALKRYYSSASSDPMIALTSNNQDVWLWRINHGTSAITSTSAVYGFGLKYIGTGDGNNNDLILYTDNQASTQKEVWRVKQDGNILYSQNLTLYTASGKSPELRFQRGIWEDQSEVDWKIFDQNGHLYFQNYVNSSWQTTLDLPHTGQGYASVDGRQILTVANAGSYSPAYAYVRPITIDGSSYDFWSPYTTTGVSITTSNVYQSQTSTTNYRPLVYGYNSSTYNSASLYTTVTSQVYTSNTISARSDVGAVYVAGNITIGANPESYRSSYKLFTNGSSYINGYLDLPDSYGLRWPSGSWWQRIINIDDSTSNTELFKFQQSEGTSGSSWRDCFSIYDNGYIKLWGGSSAGLYVATTNYTSTVLTVLDENTTYGHKVVLCGGGTTLIGAGESASSYYSSVTDENLYLMADGDVKLYSYCDTISNRRGLIWDTSRQLYPDNDLTANLGTASYRWANIYGNVLRLQGASSNPSTSAGARIEFTYDSGNSRLQPVYLSYTPNDSYRSPAGLKIIGGTDASPAWFEVEGQMYAGGGYLVLHTGNYTSYVYSKSQADDRFVNVTGDTMTGALYINTSNFNNQLHLNRTSSSGTWGPALSFDYDGTCNGTLTMASNNLYIGDNGNSRYKALHEGNSSVSKSGSTLTVKINNITQSLTNTDANVTQSQTDTTYYRGVVLGYNNVSSGVSSLETTVTSQVYVTKNIYAQSGTGTLYAKNYTFLHQSDPDSKRGNMSYKQDAFGWGIVLESDSNGPNIVLRCAAGGGIKTVTTSGGIHEIDVYDYNGFIIKRTDAANYCMINYHNTSGCLGKLGFNSSSVPIYRTASDAEYALIHAGNIGSQSVNYANSAGSANSAYTLSSWAEGGGGDYRYVWMSHSDNTNKVAYNSQLMMNLSSATLRIMSGSDYTIIGPGYLQLRNNAAVNPTANKASIEFTYSGGQAVYLGYTPNDSYRASKGLKVWGSSDDNSNCWFEVEGQMYAGGGYLVLHSGNYNNYTVTKTGSGASGTWSINVTGSAGSVAWGNVTGKPSTFAPSSHTHSYLPLSGGTLTGALYINLDSDVSSNGTTGSLIIGNKSGGSIGIDGNEIMARSGNSAATLYLQNEGGNLDIRGTTDIYAKTSIHTSGWNNQLHINRTSSSGTWGPALSFDYDGTCNGTLTMASNELYICDNGNTRYKALHTGNTYVTSNGVGIINGTTITYVNHAYEATVATGANSATNLLSENTPHYFRDPSSSSWRGGMIWGSAGTESMSFVVANSGTRFQFITGSDIANWNSSTWQTVNPDLAIYGGCIYIKTAAYITSDRTKKTNIEILSEHIRKFRLKDTNEDAYGVIAQEVPEMFREGEEGNMTVNYNSVLSYYIGLLENKVKNLEETNKKLLAFIEKTYGKII